jgi:hypothetical protein
VAKDCDCTCLTPEDIEELNSSEPEQALTVFQKTIGMVRGK